VAGLFNEIGAERKVLMNVYTGKGKGETTAALGLALRAIGHGHKVMW
jgi:cob(I)alamin adenosyltransferase